METLADPAEIDLDAVATVRPEPDVVEAMRPWISFRQAHPDSSHARGADARRAIESARAEVAALIGAPPEWVCFTSGATESNNLAIRGIAAAARRGGAARLVVPAHEHASLIHPARSLARAGALLDLVAVGRDGLVAPESLGPAPVTLLAFSYAHPELGTLQSASLLVERARRHGGVSLVDATWTAGRIASDLTSLGDPELLSVSFHRFGGPMGIGALVVSPELSLLPLLEGGIQERGLRPGSPNLAGIVGAGAASRLALQSLDARRSRLAALGGRLSESLLVLPGVRRSGPATSRLPGHVSVILDGVDGEAIVTALGERGVLSSTGSPCAQAAGLPSTSLMAAGYRREEARSAVVFCVPPVGALDEQAIDRAVAVVASELERIRRIAGLVARPEG